MKKQTITTLTMLGLMATLISSSIHAQTGRLITANIPFNFVTHNRTLPAGEYTVEPIRVGGSPALKIQSADGHVTAILPVRPTRLGVEGAEAKLVFRQYGNQYFLAQVWGLEEKGGQEVLKSSSEDRLAMDAARPDSVSIAAKRK